ncbi:sensor histidine kinase [Paenibacillus sp. CN-4]|uniref:cache domain-containing sensor histidine kinase n=1 Tax=Paenibacillus nanchangensis TaxID=3348343 RepID=UPI00397B36EF
MLYSLKSRLTVSFILLFLLSFVTLSVVLINESRQILRSNIETSAKEMMEEYALYLDMVHTQISDLASLVFNSEVTARWAETAGDPAIPAGEKMLSHIGMSRFLTRTTNSYTSVSGVTLYRQDGLWVGGDNLVMEDDTFKQEKWYADLLEHRKRWVPSHTDPVEVRQNNLHPVIGMVMPVGSFDIASARVLMKVNVKTEYFLKPLNRIRLGQTGGIFLLDEDGTPLLSEQSDPKHAHVLKALEPIRRAGQKGGVLDVRDAGGKPDIVIYKKLPKTNWLLVGVVQEKELYAELFRLRNSIMVIASLLLVLSLVLASVLSSSITKPLSRLVSAMRHVQRGDFSYAEMRIPPQETVRSEIGYVTGTFRNMVVRLRSHIQTEFELKLLRQQAEYKALLMQINPHFLFNTLELMSSLAMQKRTEDNVTVIEDLGRMMRYSLRISDDVVLLEEELGYVEHYLSILKIRFGSRLKIGLTREEGLERLTTIKFILQPLIENAVKYSLAAGTEARVSISARRADGRLHLSVTDNGPGIGEELKLSLMERLHSPNPDDVLAGRNGHIGLGNVLARCRLYYGELFQVAVEPGIGGGTRIVLSLPEQEEKTHVPSDDCGR